MKKLRFLILAVAVFMAYGATAQEIKPVWEYLAGKGNNPLPILKLSGTGPDVFDGSSVYDTYGGLKRYDANRLLLAVRENGINESDANADKILAAQYPDRSLIWIDPVDGKPMGIALVVGKYPVTLDQDFLDAGGTTDDYYYTFTVADDGVIFTGYKNKILRYAPDGKGGFTGPTVAFTFADDGSQYWSAWRWEVMHATGSGKDTKVFAGGKTWRTNQGYYLLTSQDGVNFTWDGTISINGFGGGASNIYLTADKTEEQVIITRFPGNDSGFDVNIARFFRPANSTDNFEQDQDFFKFAAPAIDLDAKNYLNTYIGWFLNAAAGNNNLDYFVVYSSPSWDTKDDETAGTLGFSSDPASTPYLPGWLALHDKATGAYIDKSARLLNIYESDEIDGDTAGTAEPGSPWHATLGDVQLNVLPGYAAGASELLWYSGLFGYGRYTIGNVGVGDWYLY